MSGTTVDLRAVNGEAGGDAGVEQGARLIAFTEAVMSSDETRRAASAMRCAPSSRPPRSSRSAP